MKKRRRSKDSILYPVRDERRITRLEMNRLLRLASQMWIARIVRWQNKKRRLRVLVMTADAGKTMHYLKTLSFMKLTVSAASRNPRKIHAILFSPDISVVVLAITNYDTLPRRATTTMTTLTTWLRIFVGSDDDFIEALWISADMQAMEQHRKRAG